MLGKQVGSGSGYHVVTGAAGHIGNTLIRQLMEQGKKVMACVHRDLSPFGGLSKGPNFQKAHADILDFPSLLSAFKDADTVFHCAALIAINRSHVGIMNEINIQGTKNVLSACRQAGVRRLVHFSSIHALSPLPETGDIDESRNFVSAHEGMPYDYSKAVAEQAVLDAVDHGLDAVIVNPTGVIGPWDWKPSFIGNFSLSICRGKIPMLVKGGFNWVDVRDVAFGANRAGEVGRAGERYILGNVWAPVTDLVEMLAGISGRARKRVVVPHWLAHVGVPFLSALACIQKRQPLYTHDSLRTLLSHKNISCNKARRELGYSPRPLQETLSDTVSWFRENVYFGEIR